VLDSLTTDDLPAGLVRGSAFVLGALWGSFFNVAIHRWPRGESVVHPGSRCPACGAPIPGWRNVPILGWLALRGRAACCGVSISPRYPLVEFLGAVLALAAAETWVVDALAGTPAEEAALEAALYFLFLGGLLVATFVDLEHMEIPDEVSLPGAAVGLATVSFRLEPGAEAAAFGAGLGFLLIQLAFVWAYEVFTGRRGMGEGDAKLMLFIGAFVGWKGVLFSLVVGAIQGVVVGVPLVLLGQRGDRDDDGDGRDASADELPPASRGEPDGARAAEAGAGGGAAAVADAAVLDDVDDDDEPPPAHVGHLKLPFGPFLALGAVEYLFFGDRILDWYVGLLR